MKIFLDTANLDDIKKYNDMGLLDGITTNPSLLAKEGGDPHQAMKEITQIIKGDVSLEVVSTDFDGMIEEGKKLREYGDHVVVKCPMTGEGLRACKSLTEQGIPVNITLVFSSNQALLAAKAGAKYVVTLPPPVLEKMLGHALTDKGLKAFLDDWQKLQAENTSK
jgi:transaldolase